MPELPDLSAFSRNLRKKLGGKQVVKIIVGNSKKLNTTTATLQKTLAGATIKTIERQGKELHITFDTGDVLALHLMLHGRLQLSEDGDEKPKYAIITLVFDDGSSFTMSDFQGAATPTLNPEPREVPDAADISATYLEEQAAGTRASIKNLLLNQKIILGIGNAYADEILWDAGIHPASASNKIPPAKIKALARSIKKVLKDAEKQILKTHPDIISGEIRDFMAVHNAHKKQSPTGGTIKTETSGGRKTYFTDEQELFK